MLGLVESNQNIKFSQVKGRMRLQEDKGQTGDNVTQG